MTVACPSRVSFLARDPLSCSAVSLPDPGGPLLYPASIPAPAPASAPPASCSHSGLHYGHVLPSAPSARYRGPLQGQIAHGDTSACIRVPVPARTPSPRTVPLR